MPQFVLYHATRATFDTFDFTQTVDGGVHAGTEAQARMRGGSSARLIALSVTVNHPRRCRDEGGNWAQRIKQARAAGHDAIVYLNRYEGIPLERFAAAEAKGVDLDKLSDSAFKKHVPEATDSYIILHPQDIYIVKPPAAASTPPQTADGPESVPVLTWPRAALKRVVHIGRMDPADKGWQGPSHEGDGLSFSTCPDAWERIARLGDRPWWETSAQDWRLLNGHACLKDAARRTELLTWARDAGLVTSSTVFEAQYLDEEENTLVTFSAPTAQAAWDEVEGKEDEPTTRVREKTAWLPTAQLGAQMAQDPRVAGQPHALTEQWVVTAWAQAHDWDGVWWADRLAPARFSAPRGMLFSRAVTPDHWTCIKPAPAPEPAPLEKPRRSRRHP
jgi:hypothetical protein